MAGLRGAAAPAGHGGHVVRVVGLGLANLDHRFWLEEFPPRRRRTRATAYREDVGGPAAVATLAVSRLGGHAVFLGRRGEDTTGQRIEAYLRAAGVETSQFRSFPGATTPLSAVLIARDGERHIIHYPGDNLPEDPGWLVMQVLDGARAVLIDGRWPRGARTLAEAARRRGLPVVLDLDRASAERWDLAGVATHVIADQEMAESSGGAAALIARIHQLGAWGAVTMSDEGVIHGGGQIRAYRVPVRDSTGAGDVFHGAFALALAEGTPETYALRFAAAAGAMRCMLAEVPTRAQVDQLMRGEVGGIHSADPG